MKYLIFLPITLLSFGVALGDGDLMQDTEGSETPLRKVDSGDEKVGGWWDDCNKGSDECSDTSTSKSVVTQTDSGDDDMTWRMDIR
jgi:hypothetical protein